MSEKPEKRSRGGLLGWIVPRRGKWHWALLRLAIVVTLIVVFRYHVLAWVAAGHNVAWKALTGSAENHHGDVDFLMRLRGPGAAMLIRIGEAEALARVKDPAMIPALEGLVGTHRDPQVRRHALRGLLKLPDDRALDAAVAALADPDEGIRKVAAEGLADRGDQRHVAAVQQAAATEPNPAVREALQEAARVLSFRGYAPDAPPPPERIYRH